MEEAAVEETAVVFTLEVPATITSTTSDDEEVRQEAVNNGETTEEGANHADIAENGHSGEVNGDGEAEEDEEDEDDVVVTIGELRDSVPYSMRSNAAGTLPTGKNIDFEGEPPAHKDTAIYDLDLATMEDRPWRKPGADLTDYFNYGFNEDTWNAYCERHRKYRAEFGVGNAEASRGILSSINLQNPLGSLVGIGRPSHNTPAIVSAAISATSGGGGGGGDGGTNQQHHQQQQMAQQIPTLGRMPSGGGGTNKIVVDLTRPPPMGTPQAAADPRPIMVARITASGIVTHQSQQQSATATPEPTPSSPIETTHRQSIDDSASAGSETPTQGVPGVGIEYLQQQAILQMIKQEPGTQQQSSLLGPPPSMHPSGLDFSRPPPILPTPTSGSLLPPGMGQQIRAGSGFNPAQPPPMGLGMGMAVGGQLPSPTGFGTMGVRQMAPPGTQEERPPGLDDEGPPGADPLYSVFPAGGQLQVSSFGAPGMAIGGGGGHGGSMGGPRGPGPRRFGGPGGGAGGFHRGYEISPPRESRRSRSRSPPVESSSRRRKERSSKRSDRDDSRDRGRSSKGGGGESKSRSSRGRRRSSEEEERGADSSRDRKRRKEGK